MLRGVGVGWGGSKLVLDINKNINNICLGCGCWATGHSSRVAMIWCQYIGSTAGYDGFHLAVAGHTAEVTLIGLHVVVSDSGYIGVAGCWVQGGLGGALVHLPVVGEVGVVGNLGVAGCGVQDICRNNAIHIVVIITAMLIAFIFIII